jgi:serine/threonine protein kinase
MVVRNFNICPIRAPRSTRLIRVVEMTAAAPHHAPFFIPAFNNCSKLSDFDPQQGHPNFDEAYARAVGGDYGRIMRASWKPPAGDGRDVIIKVMLGVPRGHVAVLNDERTKTASFFHEESILKDARNPTWAGDINTATGLITPHAAGVGHLCFTYCTGVEEDGHKHLPSTVPLVPGAPTPIYLIAMEPLLGGTLWSRLGLDPLAGVLVGVPLPRSEALWAATDLMAGLAALHKLGYAHADLKCVNKPRV